MKKVTKKKAVKAAKSITAFFKQRLAEPGYTLEKAKADVKKLFPKARFNDNPERHFSWYKSAFKRGALKGVR